MTELETLALRYDTDKGSHKYCPHYERFIGDMRLLPITMIEIGVASGASLKMWRAWMPRAIIYGFDKNGYAGDDFTVLTGNQGESNDLQNLLKTTGPFHFLVDDGSHDANDQKVSFTNLWPRLVSGGWYVVEDSFGLGSLIDLDSMGGGNGDIEEVHLIANRDGVILFLKKR